MFDDRFLFLLCKPFICTSCFLATQCGCNPVPVSSIHQVLSNMRSNTVLNVCNKIVSDHEWQLCFFLAFRIVNVMETKLCHL